MVVTERLHLSSSLRFEMPFDLQCEGCNSTIAKGVKINVLKKIVGNYYTRDICRFDFGCAYCGQEMALENICGDLEFKFVKGIKDSDLKSSEKRARGMVVKERFEVPCDLQCEVCISTIAKRVKINVVKNVVGNCYKREICRFDFECAYCGQEMALENTFGDLEFKFVKGIKAAAGNVEKEPVTDNKSAIQEFDVELFEEQRSKELLDEKYPGLSRTHNYFDMFHVAVLGPESLKEWLGE